MVSVESILRYWLDDCSERKTKPLDSHGGLSGAKLWQIAQQGQSLCLRRWPKQHPGSSHLARIHGLLEHLVATKKVTVPAVLRTKTGETKVDSDGHLWELTTWLPGTANYHEDPRPEKLVAAMDALARIHCAAKLLKCQPAESRNASQLQHRLQRLRAIEQNELKVFASASPAHPRYQLAHEWVPRIEASLVEVTRQLASVADVKLPIQWTLQDIRHDHVLFQGDRVSGVIDFGAAAVGCVGDDVVRLVGSMVGDTSRCWQHALQTYQQTRPLSTDELRTLGPLDSSATLLTAANWLRWLLVEEQVFADLKAVDQRLEWLRGRLQHLASRRGASILN